MVWFPKITDSPVLRVHSTDCTLQIYRSIHRHWSPSTRLPSRSHFGSEPDNTSVVHARLSMSAVHRSVLTLCACDAQCRDYLHQALSKAYWRSLKYSILGTDSFRRLPRTRSQLPRSDTSHVQQRSARVQTVLRTLSLSTCLLVRSR